VLESSTEPCAQCGGSGHVRSVSSVALQLLRGIEEILMKGATHNLVVRTRTDVALYVLNHKRGHLRDLENSFKVALAVVADPSVSGQQSFIIDRGEQVHTLEAAKAVLAAQVAAFPRDTEEAFDEDELDIETESEIETEETEGLADEAASGEEPGGEAGADGGPRRKRRRRRRGRPGEPREGGPARDDNDGVHVPFEAEAVAAAVADEGETDEDESDEQPGVARGDQAAGGERRPRRRGRRGGRRRRGGPEDGLVGSIADELGPRSAPEVSAAVADFDGYSAEPTLHVVQSEPVAQAPAPEPRPVQPAQQEATQAPTEAETAQEAERAAARRRSTVREKVSFLVNTPPETPAPVHHSEPEPSAPAPAASETAAGTQPRKAGWWSRRFGNGE
jgi:ribonuclease E